MARGALKLAAGERDAYLDRACGDDDVARRKAAELVEAYELSRRARGTVLSRRAFVPPPAVEIGPGSAIGSYVVDERIGEGGMAIVYRASRQGDAASKVAVKVAQRGFDVACLAHHFETETTILERLDHPNVIGILDGGNLDDGRPYLVVEYVAGLAITRYCDQRLLGLGDRLELFRQFCSAVDHVHRRRVVHRDIKPANLLVTPAGVPKLVDFGIALLLEGESAAPGSSTERPMTPQYASPEQVRGREITRRSDVYSLGVVLYELLTGRRPYGDDAEILGPREMARLLDERQPRPPSEVAAVEQMRQRLEEGLDGVVLRALAQEPEQRYDSAEELSEELGSWALTDS